MKPPTPGAWLRAGISRDGGPLLENEHVVWLQAGDRYADSRGFAGVTVHEDGLVRFHHDVGEPGEDLGRLERAAGGDMTESGTNPDGSTFHEVWTPLPGSQGPCGAWRLGPVQVVRVGRYVVHVDEHGGSFFTLPDEQGGSFFASPDEQGGGFFASPDEQGGSFFASPDDDRG